MAFQSHGSVMCLMASVLTQLQKKEVECIRLQLALEQPALHATKHHFSHRYSSLSENVALLSTACYDSTVYMERVNVELQKLAVMGVTVIVAAGDDGSSGFGIQCPIDAKLPVDTSGSGAHSITCPFDDKADCKCARQFARLKYRFDASNLMVVCASTLWVVLRAALCDES
eukprot:21069-Heterococcus_DN1.PRE.1